MYDFRCQRELSKMANYIFWPLLEFPIGWLNYFWWLISNSTMLHICPGAIKNTKLILKGQIFNYTVVCHDKAILLILSGYRTRADLKRPKNTNYLYPPGDFHHFVSSALIKVWRKSGSSRNILHHYDTPPGIMNPIYSMTVKCGKLIWCLSWKTRFFWIYFGCFWAL